MKRFNSSDSLAALISISASKGTLKSINLIYFMHANRLILIDFWFLEYKKKKKKGIFVTLELLASSFLSVSRLGVTNCAL